jgi:hypothetical protein
LGVGSRFEEVEEGLEQEEVEDPNIIYNTLFKKVYQNANTLLSPSLIKCIKKRKQ